jgi:hypothetical protein
MEREVAALQSGDEVAIGAVRSKSGSIRTTWRSSARAGAGRRRAARGGVARAEAPSHGTDAAHHVDLAHDARLCAAPARLRVTDGPVAPLTLVRTHPRLRVGGGLRPRRSLGRAHAPDVDAAFGLALRPFFITFEGCFRAEGGAPGINPPSPAVDVAQLEATPPAATRHEGSVTRLTGSTAGPIRHRCITQPPDDGYRLGTASSSPSGGRGITHEGRGPVESLQPAP